jgi:hypothetical protein
MRVAVRERAHLLFASRLDSALHEPAVTRTRRTAG